MTTEKIAARAPDIKPWPVAVPNPQHAGLIHRRPLAPSRVLAIVREVCAETNVAPWEVFSAIRNRRVSTARHLAMQIVRAAIVVNGKPPSYPQIGSWFGRDHTSVRNGCGFRKLDRRWGKVDGRRQRQRTPTVLALPAPESPGALGITQAACAETLTVQR